MLYREIARVLGAYFWIFALLLLPPLTLSFYDEFLAPSEHHLQPFSTLAFVETLLVTLALAAVFYRLGRKGKGKLFRREGLAAVVLIWLISPLLGALPFSFSGTLTSPFQAYFEAMSGFSTTGATVFEAKRFNQEGKEIPIERVFEGIERVNYVYYGTIEPVRDKAGKIVHEGIEAVSRGILFWRSFTQWIGGGGIMILFVAVLPALGIGGKFLFQSEVTGPMKESFTPRIKETASRLWKIYLGLSILEVFALFLAKPDLPLFDAITLSFSTISTGGFSIKNGNIEAYHSHSMEWVLILFMFFGSVNFTLYHFLLKGRFSKLKDPEFILYLVILAAIIVFAAFKLTGNLSESLLGGDGELLSFSDAFRKGAFMMVSAITSTGFAVANYDIWPYEIQVLMLIVTFIGGMSGSTAGGMKVARQLLLFKVSYNKIESMFRPEAIRSLQIGDKEVDAGTANNVLCFFFLFIALSVVAVFLYAIDGIDPESSIGLIACNINNMGLAFREAGPTSSCAFLSDWSLLLSSFWMVLGRLELFVILVVFIPAFWREEF